MGIREDFVGLELGLTLIPDGGGTGLTGIHMKKSLMF